MSPFDAPSVLRRHRPLLLALEAIGWLHMGGKAKIDFLERQGGEENNYNEDDWLGDEEAVLPWNRLRSWLPETFGSMNEDCWPKGHDLTLFSSRHRKRDRGLLGLLQAGHAMASGIEKNLPPETPECLSQTAPDMWLSSAFGYPVRNLLAADRPAVLTPGGWKLLLKQIERLLDDLERLCIAYPSHTTDDLTGWWNWREAAVGRNGWLRRAFSDTVAETRLPNNDVTLFDQSYVAAALFKSAVAGALLEKNFPWKEKLIKQKIRWRLLTVGLGMDHYEARAVKIGDWTGAMLARDEFFAKVRKLVEVDLAVGSLLYRDGETCVFSFPGERFPDPKDKDSGDVLPSIDDWKKWLTERIDGYAHDADLEMPPFCAISGESSRSLVGMTAEIKRARKAMAVPLFRTWSVSDRNAVKGHVCPVCRVRRNGAPSDKQQPCAICRNRRTHRLDTWLKGSSPDADTIWISEVADGNDRVALLTLNLDIEHWLDGTRLDSLRAQSIEEWGAQNSKLPSNYDGMVQWVAEALQEKGNKAKHIRKLLQSKIAPGLKDKDKDKDQGKWVPWDEFYKLMVEDRADAPTWDDCKDDAVRAAWLTHQFFRKLASPGRIYRFQRQAEEFFAGLLDQFRKTAAETSGKGNSWRTRRLLLKPKIPCDTWLDRQPYNGRLDGVPIDFLYRKDSGEFLTISNLARTLEPRKNKDALKNKAISLRNDDNEAVGELTVCEVADAPGGMASYHPVIPLELSPVRFRVLVPLAAASRCMDLASAAWKRQFSRVWDRLPLRAGIVAFPRKTPFQAVVEAVRNMEGDLGYLPADDDKPACWTIEKAEKKDHHGVSLCLYPGESKPHVAMAMPTFLCGREEDEDVFYPYVAMKKATDHCSWDFKHPGGQLYRHAGELKAGDRIFVYPSRIATLFLDGTAKRFEPMECWDVGHWRQMRTLWRRLVRKVPSQAVLRGVWEELCRRREAWQGLNGQWLDGGREAWMNLAQTLFRTRFGIHGTDLECLTEAALNGLLEWCLTWHVNILKERIPGGDLS